MGSSLVLGSLRAHNSDFKNHRAENLPLFPAETGFIPYDMMNAERAALVQSDGGLMRFVNAGMVPGVHSFIGKTQSGKTSLAIKLTGGIVEKYPNSVFYFRDAEKTTSDSRIYSLTGWDIETFNNKLDYVRYGITHDWVYNDIRNICQAKESLKDQIMIDTGRVDAQGKPIKIYPPDVYLIDSLPSLNPVDDDIKTGSRVNDVFEVGEEKVNKNIEGMRIAGSNKLLIVKLLDYLYKYNIRLVLINHITVNTGQLGENPKYIQKQMQYLKQNEKLPGGVSYLYQCTNITRTDFSSRLDDGEFGPMIEGTRNKMTMIKNKSNKSGVPVELIFDQNTGYNGLLSAFNYIYNRGYGFEGNPRSMYLKACPSVTFTKKTLWEKLIDDVRKNPSNPQFVKALLGTAKRCMHYDFVECRPDPNPDNWLMGSPSRISYKDGVTSR